MLKQEKHNCGCLLLTELPVATGGLGFWTTWPGLVMVLAPDLGHEALRPSPGHESQSQVSP